MRRRSSLLGLASKEGDRADVAGGNRSTHGAAGKGESNSATGGSSSCGAASRGGTANSATGNMQNLGDDTTAGGRTRVVTSKTMQIKQKSQSKRKHAGRRATLHRKKDKIQKRQEALARKAASAAGKAGDDESHLQEAARWREETEEAQSIIDGTHPKLVGLEKEQLERRRKLYEAPALGNLTYDRPDDVACLMMHQVNNLSTRNVREEKVEQMALLVNRYDADAWGIGEHGINSQDHPPSKTMANYFDTEVDLRSISSYNKTEKPKGHYQLGGTVIVATNTLSGYIKNTGVDFCKLG